MVRRVAASRARCGVEWRAVEQVVMPIVDTPLTVPMSCAEPGRLGTARRRCGRPVRGLRRALSTVGTRYPITAPGRGALNPAAHGKWSRSVRRPAEHRVLDRPSRGRHRRQRDTALGVGGQRVQVVDVVAQHGFGGVAAIRPGMGLCQPRVRAATSPRSSSERRPGCSWRTARNQNTRSPTSGCAPNRRRSPRSESLSPARPRPALSPRTSTGCAGRRARARPARRRGEPCCGCRRPRPAGRPASRRRHGG